MAPHYLTEDEYKRNCYYWIEIQQKLEELKKPTPWIFQSACKPMPQQDTVVVVFRNFDNSKTITVTYNHETKDFSVSPVNGLTAYD